MKRRKWLKISGVWLALNLAVMWGNSLLPGEISGAISDWVKDLLARLFSFPQIPGVSGSGLVRKAAHFLEFASLGMALSLRGKLTGKSKWMALCWGVAAACVDEGIQRFVPGRCGCPEDVCLDTCGVIFGMALFAAGCKIYQKKKDHILEEKQL